MILQDYVDKLYRKEPFCSLLYGDGEFLAACPDNIGKELAFGEVVTERLCQELQDSLLVQDPSVIRGTDLNLRYPDRYQGRDIESVRGINSRMMQVLAKVPYPIDFVDGTIWDEAVRDGKLGPFLKALESEEMVVIGNEKLKHLPFWKHQITIFTPPTNACKQLDDLEILAKSMSSKIYIGCMGLGAIPLAMRLRKAMPDITFIDLGSVLDVFVGLGEQRGWRKEMYADPVKHAACIDANLEGVLL
jgi:hypothetical protein